MPTHDGVPAGEYQPKPEIRGTANGRSRLTPKDVLAIRRMARAGTPQYEIAAQFGVSTEAVSHITTRRNWNWLKDEDEPPAQLGYSLPKLTTPEPETDPALLAAQHASFVGYYVQRLETTLTPAERLDMRWHAMGCPVCLRWAGTTAHPRTWDAPVWRHIFTNSAVLGKDAGDGTPTNSTEGGTSHDGG
jgi:hypothetical protein